MKLVVAVHSLALRAGIGDLFPKLSELRHRARPSAMADLLCRQNRQDTHHLNLASGPAATAATDETV